jgi:MFS transporter, DHA1 family, tetracycline resistance protein
VPRSTFRVLWTVVFLDIAGFGLILPSLPYYAVHLGAGGVGLGATMTAYSVVQFLASPWLGRLSDRHGRRPVLIGCLAGSAVAFAVTGLAGTLVALVLARAVSGAVGGSASVAQAYAADVTPADDRTRVFGALGTAVGIGFVAGPAIGAVFAPLGLAAVWFAAAGLALVNLLLCWRLLPEPAAAPARRSPVRRTTVLASALSEVSARRVLGATFLTTAAFAVMETTLALVGQRRFGLGPVWLGTLLAVAGLLMAAVQLRAVGPLSRRFGDGGLALTGALLMAVALPVIPWAPVAGVWIAVGALSVGLGLGSPALTALLAAGADPGERGRLMGAGQSMGALARTLAPLAAGGLFDLGLSLPYLLGTALAALAGALLVGRRVAVLQNVE